MRLSSCIESDLDKFGGNSVISTDLRDLHNVHHLVDVWRKKHGRQVQCTWFNSHKTIGTHLDEFFIPQELLDQTVSCEINPCAFSDHDVVQWVADLHNVFSHRPGIWRLNLELLEDEDFCSEMSQIIRHHVLYQKSFPFYMNGGIFLRNPLKLGLLIFRNENSGD